MYVRAKACKIVEFSVNFSGICGVFFQLCLKLRTLCITLGWHESYCSSLLLGSVLKILRKLKGSTAGFCFVLFCLS